MSKNGTKNYSNSTHSFNSHHEGRSATFRRHVWICAKLQQFCNYFILSFIDSPEYRRPWWCWVNVIWVQSTSNCSKNLVIFPREYSFTVLLCQEKDKRNLTVITKWDRPQSDIWSKRKKLFGHRNNMEYSWYKYALKDFHMLCRPISLISKVVDLRTVCPKKYFYCFTDRFIFVGSRIKNDLSSFELDFLNIFSRQNLLRSLSLVLFLLQRHKYGAKKCPKTTFDSTSEMIRF